MRSLQRLKRQFEGDKCINFGASEMTEIDVKELLFYKPVNSGRLINRHMMASRGPYIVNYQEEIEV